MKVKLVQATENPIEFLADIASICYGHEKAKNPEKLVKHLFENGHDSVFEHVFYTWKIEGVSRACLAQLTRHRHASYTVRSQRYCEELNRYKIIPRKIEEITTTNLIYKVITSCIEAAYEELLHEGISKEDARFILPQAIATDLYMSCNLRELIHICNLRNSKHAQWEIRDLVRDMVKLVTKNSPGLVFMFKEEI